MWQQALNILEAVPAKIVPISHDQEPGAAASKKELALTRRSVFKGIGVLAGMLVIDSPLMLLALSTVQTVELEALSKTEGGMLLQMRRTLLPRTKLPNTVYALLIKDLGAKAAQGAQVTAQLREGITVLDKLAGSSFIKASTKRCLTAVKATEGKPSFDTAQGQRVTSLYDSGIMFVTFGCSRLAWERRDCIARNFQDLKWLPTLPTEANPPSLLG